jgi:deferrochelatase/peroxidase EfeB
MQTSAKRSPARKAPAGQPLPWIAIAITYQGLVALGVSEDSLQSFPEALRVGMAAGASRLRDYGDNDPKRWNPPFGSGLIHIGVSVFSNSEETWRRTMASARQHYEGYRALAVLATQDFGAQPGDLNPLGYKDSTGQPAIEGCSIKPLPGQGRPIKAGEFVLGYPGQAGVPLPAPRPDELGRKSTFVGLRKYQSQVGRFNRFLNAHARTEDERELLAAKPVGRWRSGAPLTSRRPTMNRCSAQTCCGTTTSPTPPTPTASKCRLAHTCSE